MSLQARDYLRVSLDRSGRARSLDEQHTDNERAAERNGWTLAESYRDKPVSASRYSDKARQGYDQLVADLEADTFTADVLILWESSRGSRRVGEWVLLCDLLAERGIHVHVTTHSRTYDPANPRDRRSLLEDAVDSEYESGKLSTRMKRSAAADAAAGKPPSRPAFGHPRRDVSEGQVESEREAIRATYAGLFSGRTLVKLAEDLRAQGHRTTRGGQWTRSEVRAMLLSPRHAGIRYLHGERIAEGTWEPVVAEETWQAAVHLLSDPKRRQNHGSARRWLGGQLYQCGQCSQSDMRVNYRDDGTRVYRCRANGHNNRTAETVDAYVRATIAERLRSQDVAELLGEDHSQELSSLHEEATGLRRRLDDMGVDYADGTLTAGQVRAATERINGRLAEIDEQLARIGRRNHLASLLTQDDPGDAFLNAELDVQRAVIDAVATVTLLPNPRRRWGLMSETVHITPRR